MNLSLNSLIAQAMKPQTIEQAQAGMPAAGKESNRSVVFDSINSGQGNTFDAVADFVDKSMKSDVISMIKTWAETGSSDLGDGESMADRLFGLLIGMIDENKDGELSDDESDMFDAIRQFAVDYLVGLGVDEDDASALLNDFDDSVADSIADAVSGDDRNVLDCVFDALPAGGQYKKMKAVRGGKVVTINKRIGGTVKLTDKQKIQLAKLHSKSRTAMQVTNWMHSMQVRKKAGLKNQSKK